MCICRVQGLRSEAFFDFFGAFLGFWASMLSWDSVRDPNPIYRSCFEVLRATSLWCMCVLEDPDSEETSLHLLKATLKKIERGA